jgi:catechol 2,3-dioxygenase-like lactoylglutathione lyase family enzyme
MLKAVSHVTLWVDDQDEALAFYTDKLGCEVRDDVTVEEMDNFRWLTVGAPGQPDLRIALLRPDTIPTSPETLGKLKDVIAQGAAGGLIFDVDDCRSTAEDLKRKGVEFTQEPVEQFYGIDAGIRDPFGNQHRLVQRVAEPAQTA